MRRFPAAHETSTRSRRQADMPEGPRSYSFIHESTLTSVIPPRHDEHARFIPGATPFYAGAFLVPGAFLVFCYLWLQLGGVEGDKVGREREGKKQK